MRGVLCCKSLEKAGSSSEAPVGMTPQAGDMLHSESLTQKGSSEALAAALADPLASTLTGSGYQVFDHTCKTETGTPKVVSTWDHSPGKRPKAQMQPHHVVPGPLKATPAL